MSDLISREALRREIYKDMAIEDNKRVVQLLQAIMDAPTVDAEPVRNGRWATDEEDIKWGNSLKRKHCTNCGKRPHFDKEKREFILTDYCPHCGAKMDGGAESA